MFTLETINRSGAVHCAPGEAARKCARSMRQIEAAPKKRREKGGCHEKASCSCSCCCAYGGRDRGRPVLRTTDHLQGGHSICVPGGEPNDASRRVLDPANDRRK